MAAESTATSPVLSLLAMHTPAVIADSMVEPHQSADQPSFDRRNGDNGKLKSPLPWPTIPIPSPALNISPNRSRYRRVSVRSYLHYLVECGLLTKEYAYGRVGRPAFAYRGIDPTAPNDFVGRPSGPLIGSAAARSPVVS